MRQIFFSILNFLFARRPFRITSPDPIKPGQVLFRTLDHEDTHKRDLCVVASPIMENKVAGQTEKYYILVNLGQLVRKYIYFADEYLRDGGVIPNKDGQMNEWNRTYWFQLRLPVGAIKKLIPLCDNAWEIGRGYQITKEGTLAKTSVT